MWLKIIGTRESVDPHEPLVPATLQLIVQQLRVKISSVLYFQEKLWMH